MSLDTAVKEKEMNIKLKSSNCGCKLCLVKIRVKYTATGGAHHFYPVPSFISN